MLGCNSNIYTTDVGGSGGGATSDITVAQGSTSTASSGGATTAATGGLGGASSSGTGGVGGAGGAGGIGGSFALAVGDIAPDFSLIDQNPASPTANQPVSPRDYLMRASGWYFGHAT
jgi:hypothetical protein